MSRTLAGRACRPSTTSARNPGVALGRSGISIVRSVLSAGTAGHDAMANSTADQNRRSSFVSELIDTQAVAASVLRTHSASSRVFP